jgi:TatD DNase family protein
MIVDSHCHLNFSEKELPLVEVLNNAKKNNIGLMLNIATNSIEYDNLINTSNLYKEVYFTLGVHPHEANDLNNKVIEKIYINKNNKKFIGIGETGLDFYYNNSDKLSQINSFEKQIEIAQNLSLPIVIHMRNAENEMLEILEKNQKKKHFNGVIHCFTSNQKFADAAIALGFYISASGIITFKKSDQLRDIFKNLPNNKILVETDSPYLSPEPLRGKVNQPSHIIHTIKKLSEIKNISYNETVNLTKSNFLKLFNKVPIN